MTTNTARSKKRPPARARGEKKSTPQRSQSWLLVGLGVLVAIGVLVAVYTANRPKTTAGSYRYDVGSPGPGQRAPDFALQAADGSTVTLSSLHGQTVLLYFQEGLTCQPCWDQLTDIEQNMNSFNTAGIDRVVTITTDPADALKQKVTDEGITSPVLSDPDLAVSNAYQTNSYGMMGNSRDGHSFIVVGPDGVIRWRADYGGPPDFTMYLPVPALLADLQQGIAQGRA